MRCATCGKMLRLDRPAQLKRDAEIIRLIKRGLSWTTIARTLDLTKGVVAGVAFRHRRKSKP